MQGSCVFIPKLQQNSTHFLQAIIDRRLNVEGLLATKLHAILDRGTRRDFFDLYVLMLGQRRGIADCLAAIRNVYKTQISEPLLLRALTYFVDANRESPLPNEGADDWEIVQEFFVKRVTDLLLPPHQKLVIQSERIDVRT